MTLNDNDVRAVLHRATDHLAGPPDLLDDVRRGGRRRVVRRRAVLTTGLAVAAAASAGGVLRWGGTGSAVDVASPVFDNPTRGDLANDQEYLRQLREVWARGEFDEGLRGELHVVWAGMTPVGKAAFVAQRSASNPVVTEPDGNRLIGFVAFVEPTRDGPRVMTVEMVDDRGTLDGNSQAAILGPDRDVLLIIDFGQPVVWSPDLAYTPDGKVERTFAPVVFRNGAAVLAVPPQRNKVTVALSRPPVAQENRVHITNTSAIINPGGRDRPPPETLEYVLPGTPAAGRSQPRTKEEALLVQLAMEPYWDAIGTHTSDPDAPNLRVRGATPDGRLLWVESVQYDDDPTRAVALLGRGKAEYQAVASGVVDWKAPLPLRLRLPDGQGTLVVAPNAALDHRAGTGGWLSAGRSAALLPATATEVRVTPASGPAHVVPLS
ncbi:hypothetical protein WEI85_30680 [Actinomycetes bacterium KLBMP 9797]